VTAANFPRAVPRKIQRNLSDSASVNPFPWGHGGDGAHCNIGGLTMRIWLWVGMLIASTVSAYAGPAVPEIDAFSGMAAMGVVGSIAALIWERRRK
jgi:hypothetical protein